MTDHVKSVINLVGLTAVTLLVACAGSAADGGGISESSAGSSAGERANRAAVQSADKACSERDAGTTAGHAACADAKHEDSECGNGDKDPGEDCDDGNQMDGDDCPANCHIARCRNGRIDPGEECDDGNENDKDGCNNRCKIMMCGDGKQQDHEECDDGNQVDADACSNHCTKNECGNQRVDPGEECDEEVDCDKCKRPKDDRCRQCEEQHCRKDFPEDGVEIDWVAGCLDNKPDPEYVVNAVEPEQYSKPCRAVLTCARNNHCVTGPDRGAQDCVCGTASAGDCQDEKKANGPCRDLYLQAAFTTTWLDMFKRVEDASFPLGYASLLLKCDAQFCKAECAPWLAK